MSRRSRSRSAPRTYDRSENGGRKRDDRYSRDERDSGYDRRRRNETDHRRIEYDYSRKDKNTSYSSRGEGGSRGQERRDDYDRDRHRARSRSPRSRPGPSSRRSASPHSRPRSRSKPAVPEDDDIEDKAKPNFKPSGLLAAETKKVQHSDGTSTVLKYHEPPEARKPSLGWRLYVFKGKEQVGSSILVRLCALDIGTDQRG